MQSDGKGDEDNGITQIVILLFCCMDMNHAGVISLQEYGAMLIISF